MRGSAQGSPGLGAGGDGWLRGLWAHTWRGDGGLSTHPHLPAALAQGFPGPCRGVSRHTHGRVTAGDLHSLHLHVAQGSPGESSFYFFMCVQIHTGI